MTSLAVVTLCYGNAPEVMSAVDTQMCVEVVQQ